MTAAAALASGHGSSDWRELAACRSRHDLDFFDNRQASVLACKAVCRVCPVIDECREEAARLRPTEGVWAGYLRGQKMKLAPVSPMGDILPAPSRPLTLEEAPPRPKHRTGPVLVWLCCKQPECVCQAG